VGSHTVSHPILVGLTEEKQRYELGESRNRLQQILTRPPLTFAYPDGAWDEFTATRVQEAGYTGALTLSPEVACPGGNMFAIPRILARNDPHFVGSLH
jgi:peptidoglycan/xylan/chitin deacetylase (PgdA/CDA1 family)